MEKKRRRFLGSWILVLLSLVACARLPAAGEAGPSDLSDRVGAYLRADEEMAQNLLPDLARRPVSELESALRSALAAPRGQDAPTGMLPDRPIEVSGHPLGYGLYVPESYVPSRPYPLIICLHGAGFSGDSYLERWQPRLGEDYILACPTIAGGAWWSPEAEKLVLAVLSDVSQHYHVDYERVFLTGMSNGGIGTFLIGLNHADRFAALVPMAAAFPRGLYPLLDNAREVPLYLIHGAEDQIMPVRFSREVASYLKDRKQEIVYREHEHVHPMAGGHFFPREELPDLVSWLRDRRRKNNLGEVSVVRDREHPGRFYWVRLEEISPDAGSLWASQLDREESRRLEEGAYARLTAKISGNTISVTSERVLRYTLMLNGEIVDFQEPVRVVSNDRVVFEGNLTPNSSVLLQEARRRPDPEQLVLALVEVSVPADE